MTTQKKTVQIPTEILEIASNNSNLEVNKEKKSIKKFLPQFVLDNQNAFAIATIVVATAWMSWEMLNGFNVSNVEGIHSFFFQAGQGIKSVM